MKIRKQKPQKCVSFKKIKFDDHKHCLKATQLKNKINHLEKNKINMDSLKEDHQEFIKIIN